MDMSFQGLVTFPIKFVRFQLVKDYVPKKGMNANLNMGDVFFAYTTGDATKRFDTIGDALTALAADKNRPEGARVYVNSDYYDPEEAAELDLAPYVYKRAGHEAGWRVQFLTEATVAATNGKKPKAKKAKKAKKATKKATNLY
jgi:hypothetical protein